MTYWQLDVAFVALAVVIALVGLARRRTAHWRAVALVAAGMVVATAVFDNVMIAVGLVAYDPAHILGAFVGVAPIEDFAYPVAAAIGLPALWHLLPHRRADDRV